MTWIPYNKAIAKNITGYPKIGESVLYKARGGKYPVWYQAKIERIINLRRYIVRYNVPEEIKKHFIGGTTSAVVKIDDLSYFCSVNEEPSETEEIKE